MQSLLSRDALLRVFSHGILASVFITIWYFLNLAFLDKWAGGGPIGGWMVPVILITASSGLFWGIAATIAVVLIRVGVLHHADHAVGLINISNFVISSSLVFGAIAIQTRLQGRKRSLAMINAANASIANLVRQDVGNAVMFDNQMRFVSASKSWQKEFMPEQYWDNYEGISHYDMMPWTQEKFGASHKKVLAGEHIESLSQIFTDDTGKTYFHSWRMMPWRQLDGEIAGAILFGVDHRDIYELGDRQRDLIAELNHRTKNVLAIVGAIASQTALKAPPHVFVETFQTRLKGLARTYDLLFQNENHDVNLQTLIDVHVDWSIYGARINRECCKVLVSKSAAQSIGMALNELMTNAIKHGSLTSDEGVVDIIVTAQTNADEQSLHILWKERGGPEIAAFGTPSYGLELLTRKTEHSLNAKVQCYWDPDGFRWECSVPMNQVAPAPSLDARVSRAFSTSSV